MYATGGDQEDTEDDCAYPASIAIPPVSSASRSPLGGSSGDLQDSIARPAASSRTSVSSRGEVDSNGRAYQDRTLDEEAHALFSDINNYLALGCLCSGNRSAAAPETVPGQWREVTNHELLLVADGELGSHIARLISHRWIRVQMGRCETDQRITILRTYILPGDVGLRFLDRQNRGLYIALEHLIAQLDVSAETWAGRSCLSPRKFDVWATRDDGSLFYMFNTLPSPAPSVSMVKEKYTREALEDLLDPSSALPGLKTELYPYQRRSAGLMLQREFSSELLLDPRLEPRKAPDGSAYYYGAREMLFMRSPRHYEACRGGILSETMGLGKTVICLAAILATKYHLPKVPSPYQVVKIRTAGAASLTDMVVSSINRKSIPWKIEFERIRQASGHVMRACTTRLEAEAPTYTIPVEPTRWNRKTVLPPPQRVTLAATTIVVVPRNLCKQWHAEIKKHVDEDALKILVMEDLRSILPPPNDLREYDLVLFSRNRFEQEIKDGSDDEGRRIAPVQAKAMCQCPYIGASRKRDCRCVREDLLYDSPLKHLHFKRLVIDEGHFFSATNTAAVTVANRLVKADHRWVISGTPAKDLLGIEADVSSATSWQVPETSRDAALEGRRNFSSKDDTSGAIKSLGALACNFLQVRPWCASDVERPLVWDDYIYRHEDPRKRTYSGFSTCLRRTLKAMVVKTQPGDVERDIELPPLSHELVYLEPSYYDKLSANLFTLVLTANAVTSERTDADYLFHKNSAKARYQLVNNLRQSAFFWTGFSEADIEASCENGQRYLSKGRDETECSEEDRSLMSSAIKAARKTFSSQGWKAMSRSHEIGLFVEDWPSESAEFWTFDGTHHPLLTGVSQLLEAQKHVNSQSGVVNPGDGLNGLGIASLAPARQRVRDVEGSKSVLTRSGLPSSSIDGEPLKRRGSLKIASPQKKRSSNIAGPPISNESPLLGTLTAAPEPTRSTEGLAVTSTKSRKRKRSEAEPVAVAPSPPEQDHLSYSKYSKSRIVGTTSAKLSYLLSQILKHARNEKILVFYDGDNVAYYIAQALELLHIKHEIYAKSLPQHLKSEYIVRFDQEPQDRVLLMDVKQAAFGLNLSSASRIYFVNPVCQPNIEAQAIKRAHRIGQNRKVYVETLVLRGGIEEKMLERAKRMTRSEHQDAKHLEDDGGIREIIQSAQIMPVTEKDEAPLGQIAPLDIPQQLWAREGWREALEEDRGGKRHRAGEKTPRKKANRGKEHQPLGPAVETPAIARTPEQSVVERLGRESNESDDEPLLLQRLGMPRLSNHFAPLAAGPTASATAVQALHAQGESMASASLDGSPSGTDAHGFNQASALQNVDGYVV